MARQKLKHNPSVKEFEAYLDFSGGRNSELSNEKLKDNECPVLDNVDLSSRGSAKLRYGRRKILSRPGNAQGVFFYYRQGADEPDVISAISGRLYVKEAGKSTDQEISITKDGNAFTFQTTLPIEAVQYKSDLFVATGSGLVEVTYNKNSSKWEAKTVTPYTPTVMEAIYIGTNGLADNPDQYVQDGVSTNLEVTGIKPAKRTGAVNQEITMTAFISKPNTITSVEYKWEYKKSSDTSYTVGRDFTEGTTGKVWKFVPDTATNYDIKLTVRDKAVPATVVNYTLTNYVINQVEDKGNTDLSTDAIQTCRKIMLHWDRLLLSLDNKNPYQMYISDLNNPRYFPVTNTISWDTGKQEPITSILRFRDMLIVFTKTTIQTLVGKSVDDYRRSLIHDDMGCIADRTARVVGNVVVFLSHEGVMMLKPNAFTLEVMNVSRLDTHIRSEIIPSANACAITADGQYWIAFPDQSVVYRLYYETGVWVKDTSSKLDIVEFISYGEDVYNLRKNGDLLIHDKGIYVDDGEKYPMIVDTKNFDLSVAFNYKKLKRLYVLARHFETHNVGLLVHVFADSGIALSPDKGEVIIDANDYVVWKNTTEPNFNFYAGTSFGSWILGISPFGGTDLSVQKTSVRGKCRRVRIRFEFEGGTPCEIYGFGIEFKVKKP